MTTDEINGGWSISNICVILFILAAGLFIYYRVCIHTEEKEKETTKEGFNPFKIVIGLFKLIPIVINVFSHMDRVFNAFMSASQGLIYSVINIAISSSFLFVDTFRFSIAVAKYAFLSIVCTMENLSNMKYCIWFYLIDVFVAILQMLVVSTFTILDDMFGLPGRGFSLVELLDKIGEYAEEGDQKIYDLAGFHVFGYPDSIISLCYKCSNPPDKKELERNIAPFKYDVAVRLPPLFWQPINYFIDAGMNLASAFSGF